jgi:CubicO group peptidase (beta-lactamase class C family)
VSRAGIRVRFALLVVFGTGVVPGCESVAIDEPPNVLPKVITAGPMVSGEAWSSLDYLDAMILQFMEDNHIPGATVAVSQQGRLIFNKAYGYADLEAATQMQPWHRTRIGSVSKIITALSMMKLTELRGMDISLDERLYEEGGILGDEEMLDAIAVDLAKYDTVEEKLQRWSWYYAVTPRHLLGQCSGYAGSGDTEGAAEEFNGGDEESLTYKQIHMWYVMDKGIDYEPASKGDYANHNLGLAGYIVSAVSGQSYIDFAREVDVVPWKSDPSELDATPYKWVDPVASGDGGPGDVLAIDPPPFYEAIDPDPATLGTAAGGWTATARDLVRLMCATDQLGNHSDVLSPAKLDEMESRPFPDNVPGYAHTWWINNNGRLNHNGIIGGGRSDVVKFPAGYVVDGIDVGEINVAVCVNIQPGVSLYGLAEDVAKGCAEGAVPVHYDLFGGTISDSLAQP